MNDKFRLINGFLMRNGRIHRRIVENRISNMGIHSSQHMLLMHLKAAGRISSQTQIASMMDVSPASIARMLKCMEAGGYIERFDVSCDGRKNEIGITRKGEDVLERSVRIFEETDRVTYAGFSDEELDTLAALLKKMQDNLSRYEKEEKSNIRGEMNEI